MLNWYRADLHIHSVLSPCGGLEMSAKNVMQRVKELGISIIAITDHNSMANCAVYKQAAEEMGITCFWGVEIQTSEEIHLIALFASEIEAQSFDKELYQSLLPIDNNPDFFGDQVVIDKDENIVCFETRALINSSMWSLDEVVEKLKGYDSFFYPAHIDAEAFSVLGQLGFLPTELKFDALGVTASCNLERFLTSNPTLKGYSLLKSSDAHYLKDLGSGYTDFYLEKPTLNEMRLACQNKCTRKYDVK